jgi:hypothetical protein
MAEWRRLLLSKQQSNLKAIEIALKFDSQQDPKDFAFYKEKENRVNFKGEEV